MKSKPKAKKPLAYCERGRGFNATLARYEAAKLPAPPRSAPVSAKEKRAEYIDNLPEHLSAFGLAVWKERDTCRKLLADAMETYDDAVYDAVIDATPKEVLDVMKKGREAILTHADSILSVACDCAGDHVAGPKPLAEMIVEEGTREAGETTGAAVSDMRSINQREFLQGFLSSLTPDAREMLEAMT